MTNKQDELLPCPFCGSQAHMAADEGEMVFVVSCINDECGAEIAHMRGSAARELWNTRPTPSDEVEPVYQRQFIPGNWKDVTEEKYNNMVYAYPRRIVYLSPITAEQAAADVKRLEEAIFEKAALACEDLVENGHPSIPMWGQYDNQHAADQACLDCAKVIRALSHKEEAEPDELQREIDSYGPSA